MTATPNASGARPAGSRDAGGNGGQGTPRDGRRTARGPAPDRAIAPVPGSSPAGSVRTGSAGDRGSRNGYAGEASSARVRDELKHEVREVEAARARLGEDLERLNYEVRAQMGVTVEKLAWKVAVVGSSIVAVLGTKALLTAGWKAAMHTDPPTNPANPQTQWSEALTWTIATAATAAVAKVFAARAAASGWQKATGSPAPGLKS